MKRTWQVAAVLGVYMACFVFFQTKWAALVLGGILPAVAAAGAIVLSVRSAIRNFGAVQLVLGVPSSGVPSGTSADVWTTSNASPSHSSEAHLRARAKGANARAPQPKHNPDASRNQTVMNEYAARSTV